MMSEISQIDEWVRCLPNGKPISALGFGCSSAWAKPGFDNAEAQRLLEALVEEGVNHFDTSPSYGAGTGEVRLGQFLRTNKSSEMVVSTKVGTNLINGRIVRGFQRDLIEESFAASLERLGLRSVDILYLHGPSLEDLHPGSDVHSFFEDMKSAGKITYSGVNSFEPAVLDAVSDTAIDCVMLQFNVDDFRNVRQLERLSQIGKFVISGTVLSRAKFKLSTFLPRNSRSLWYLLRMIKTDPLFAWNGWKLKRRLMATGLDPVTAAIRFATGHPMVLSNLFGTSTIEHARANARSGHGVLDPAMREALAKGRMPARNDSLEVRAR